MSKRFNDDKHHFANLSPDTDMASNSAESKFPQRRTHEQGPAPLTVEETVEVLGEIDKLNERLRRQTDKIRELTSELEARNQELEALKLRNEPTAQAEGNAEAAPASSEAEPDAKDKEIADLKDKYLRALADQENARRRIRQQSEDSVKRQKENLLRDLLPILDNLERAVDASKGKSDAKSIIEGVQMVLASLLDLLKNNGVRPMTSVGEQFDPNKHEAADHVPHTAHPPNTVVSEFHRGYQINDKVLRPARVVVSKRDDDGKGT
jgi:molecular chaperone GrpE